MSIGPEFIKCDWNHACPSHSLSPGSPECVYPACSSMIVYWNKTLNSSYSNTQERLKKENSKLIEADQKYEWANACKKHKCCYPNCLSKQSQTNPSFCDDHTIFTCDECGSINLDSLFHGIGAHQFNSDDNLRCRNCKDKSNNEALKKKRFVCRQLELPTYAHPMVVLKSNSPMGSNITGVSTLPASGSSSSFSFLSSPSTLDHDSQIRVDMLAEVYADGFLKYVSNLLINLNHYVPTIKGLNDSDVGMDHLKKALSQAKCKKLILIRPNRSNDTRMSNFKIVESPFDIMPQQNFNVSAINRAWSDLFPDFGDQEADEDLPQVDEVSFRLNDRPAGYSRVYRSRPTKLEAIVEIPNMIRYLTKELEIERFYVGLQQRFRLLCQENNHIHFECLTLSDMQDRIYQDLERNRQRRARLASSPNGANFGTGVEQGNTSNPSIGYDFSSLILQGNQIGSSDHHGLSSLGLYGNQSGTANIHP